MNTRLCDTEIDPCSSGQSWITLYSILVWTCALQNFQRKLKRISDVLLTLWTFIQPKPVVLLTIFFHYNSLLIFVFKTKMTKYNCFRFTKLCNWIRTGITYLPYCLSSCWHPVWEVKIMVESMWTFWSSIFWLWCCCFDMSWSLIVKQSFWLLV